MKIALLFILSLSTFANFTGRWSGEGYYESDRKEGKCKEIFMHFKQTQDRFMILDGGYICGEIQAQYPPSSFEIENGNLYYQNTVVGLINEKYIEISYLNGEFSLRLQKVKDEVHYLEEWAAGDDFLKISSKMGTFSQ